MHRSQLEFRRSRRFQRNLRSAAVAAACAALAGVPAVRADVAGFTSGGTQPDQFTLNGNAAAQTAGVPAISANSLQLTANAGSLATSAFYNTPQSINNWTASFTYQMGAASSPPADGFAFVLQNDPRGPAALGASGGGIGYAASPAITPSAAVTFDLYNGANTSATPTRTGTGRNGSIVDLTSTNTVNLRSGNPITVNLAYNDGVLTESLNDAVAGTTFTRTLNRNFTYYVGGNSAYVGFTGGTGGATAQQTVSNFTYTAGNAPAVAAAGPLITGVPQGGAGTFGVREVTNNNAVATIADAEASITTDRSGSRRVVDYAAPNLDIFDSDQRGDYSNDRPYASAAAPGPGVGNVDNLALVSTGTVRIPSTGYYTFAVRSDDGFRLTIGGQRFETAAGQGGTTVNANGALEFGTGRGAGAANRSFGQIYLPAGDYPLQLLHWEGTGGASLELTASAGQKTAQDLGFNLVGGPARQITRRAGSIVGGFEVVNFSGVASLADAVTAYQNYRAGTRSPDSIATAVPTVFYSDPQGRGVQRSGQSDFGADRPFPNDTSADDNTFATGARGTLRISTGGRYTFDVLADDSTRLRITDSGGNDVDLAGVLGLGNVGAGGVNTDADAANDAVQTTGCCSDAFGYYDLQPGDYTLELIHQEGGGGSSLALFGAFGTWEYFDPSAFQLLGQNLDTTVTQAAGLQLVAVPEPAAAGLLGLGALGLLARRRRQSRATAQIVR